MLTRKITFITIIWQRVAFWVEMGGLILADNSMCALLYDETDERSKKLHEFNQFVKKRVEQVILTIREGISKYDQTYQELVMISFEMIARI